MEGLITNNLDQSLGREFFEPITSFFHSFYPLFQDSYLINNCNTMSNYKVTINVYKVENVCIYMKKTTIKISHDNLWELNIIASTLSKKYGEKITQDETIRYLCEYYINSHPGAPNEQNKAIERGIKKK